MMEKGKKCTNYKRVIILFLLTKTEQYIPLKVKTKFIDLSVITHIISVRQVRINILLKQEIQQH